MLKARCSHSAFVALCGLALSFTLSVAALAPTTVQDGPGSAMELPPDEASGPEQIVAEPGPAAVIGTLTLHPEVVNLKAKGSYLTGFLGVPEGYSLMDVYLPSIRLNGVVYVETCFGHQLLNVQGDGPEKLLLKFVKLEARQVLSPGDDVTVFITGVFVDGTPLYAEDTATIVDR